MESSSGWGGCSAHREELQAPTSYQNVQQLLQVAADDTLIFIEGPAALLGIVLPPSQVCKDHLQPLLVVADLARGQGSAQVLGGKGWVWLSRLSPISRKPPTWSPA